MKRGNYALMWLFCCSLLFCFLPLPSGAAEHVLMQLRGHLTAEKLAEAQNTLTNDQSGFKGVVIEIDSNSGDIESVLNFAKMLYLKKLEKNLSVVLYIDGKALGPAAMLPFVADELYISPFVSWGDVPYGSEGVLPGNILRSQVVSLIDAAHYKRSSFLFLAGAMTDKELPPFDGMGNLSLQDLDPVPGQPLVVNQQQLQKMGILQGILSEEEFRAKWHFSPEQLKAHATEESLAERRAENFRQELAKYLHIDKDRPFTVGHLIIEDHSSSISQATWLYMKNGLEYYKRTKPAFVILELNTPGGEVFAAQKISDALKELDTQYDIPVLCYINNWAISAGAMLAYSCRFIASAKDGSMGAAEPVIMGEDNQMKTASEKVNSALRTDFANRARFFDRNPLLAEAMVDKDIILVLRHGRIVKLDAEAQIRQGGLNPDKVITPKGKLLTLNAAEMMEYGVADLLLAPTKVDAITAQEKESGKWKAKQMQLFAGPDLKPFAEAAIDSYQMDWKLKFLSFLAQPFVSSLLLLGVILGFYVELSTPGFGIAGSIGLISLILIVLSSFALEIASWLEVILLALGALILVAELFFIPTFGLLGIFGVLCFAMGLLGLLIPGLSSVEYEFDTQTFNAAGEVVLERLLWLSGTILAAFAIILVLARFVSPYLAGYSRLVLSGNEQDTSLGYVASGDPAKMPKIGRIGKTLSPLRPAGKIIIDGQILDGISQGSFIAEGVCIVVIGNEGSSVIVKPSTIEGEEA